MPITPQQETRLKGSMRGLYRSPDFMTIRQFITAESAKDAPDYAGLKRIILAFIEERLDEEINGTQIRRNRERGLAI